MDQLSIFDFITEDKPLPTDIKLLSLFSGIGAFEKALDRIGVGYELVNYCEIDRYASRSYAAVHGVSEDKNLWDVTKVDEKALPKDIDLLTYGFPCQDISLAGKQKGLFNDDGSKTRSGLFFDALRIIEETKPRVAIAENVKNLVGKKFNAQFQIVLASLEAAGYNNYYQVLNSKDYGIPQNRERVFIVSIRKDIDKGYTFPKGFPLEKRLKDVLEDTADEKYYLSDKAIAGFNRHKERHSKKGHGFGWQPTDASGVAFTLQTSSGTRPNDNYIELPGIKQVGQGIIEPAVLQLPRGKNKGGIKEISPMLTSNAWEQNNFCAEKQIQGSLRIRKLTPKECFRLMGFDDSDFHKAELVNSNTQLYKQAGNSIVVDVLEYILKQIFKAI